MNTPTIRLVQRHGAWLLLALVMVFATARHDAFLTPENIFNVLRQNSMVAIVALGMTFVIVLGGVDLSVGALVALGGITAATLSARGSLAAIVGALAVTGAIGFVNGLVIVKVRLAPFVVTLASMFTIQGFDLLLAEHASVKVDRGATLLRWLGRGMIGVVPAPVLVVLVLFVAGWVVLRHSRFGLHVYAVGDNAHASRLMGLDVPRVSIAVYVISGTLAGLAGAVLAARLGAAQAVAGMGWELDAIAAVVVGGALLSGGQGGVWPTLSGLLLLGVVFNVINLEGSISSFWQQVLRGVFLLALIVLQNRLAASAREPASTTA